MEDLIDSLVLTLMNYMAHKQGLEMSGTGNDGCVETGKQASAHIAALSEAHYQLGSIISGLIYHELLEYGILSPEVQER